MSDVTPGVEALLGRLKVYVVRCEATFEPDPECSNLSGAGPHPTVVEISVPKATLGRGDVDLRLVGPASRDVSRRHLLVQPAGRQWTITDCGSSNGTFEEDPETHAWRVVPRDYPIPVERDLLLCLGTEMLLRFELLSVPSEGRTTSQNGVGGPRVGMQRIHPVKLEAVAMELLSCRRAKPRDRRVPSVPRMVDRLGDSRSAIYRSLKTLEELEEVAPFLADEATPGYANLAEALVLAFPYLVAPSPMADA